MKIVNSVLELIGNTPMLKVNRLDTGLCELYLKLENQNPGGSIKDRIGLSMVEAAEKRGELKPGATLVEGTAGNTGIGLALVAAQKGYQLILVIPDKMSKEKIFNLKAMGAEIVLTRSDVAKGHPQYYQDLAKTIAAQTPNSYFINQFGNPDNPQAHIDTTMPEIMQQMDNDLDAIVFGVGSSGTMSGMAAYLKEKKPSVEMILADPIGSILAEYINEKNLSDKSGSWKVEGIGEDFLPSISDFSLVTKAFAVSDKESFEAGRELLAKEGVLGGSSTGTIMTAALKYCQQQTAKKRVVALVPDTGNKYLSKMYNDYWMMDNGFIEVEQYGDLRDLISRPYQSNDLIVMRPQETLATVYQRMKLYDVSQLPIVEDDEIVGIIDESDVMMYVYDDNSKFEDEVAKAMTKNLEFMPVTSPLAKLLPVFDQGRIAIVKDDDGTFLGLITRIDLLNYLRRRDNNQ